MSWVLAICEDAFFALSHLRWPDELQMHALSAVIGKKESIIQDCDRD